MDHAANCRFETLENRRLLAMNWGLYPKLMNQDKAVADFPNITGKGVNVAIIDTGFDIYHPKLQGVLWTNPDEIAGDGIDNDHDGQIDNLHGWDYVEGDNVPQDINSHGTQMAGIIAAKPFKALAEVKARINAIARTGIPEVNAMTEGFLDRG